MPFRCGMWLNGWAWGPWPSTPMFRARPTSLTSCSIQPTENFMKASRVHRSNQEAGVARFNSSRNKTGISTTGTRGCCRPLLDKLIDPARFPVATRVGTSAGQEYQSASSPEFAFTFGLERILAGIAELIAAKNSEENTHH